jgi:hypothetical protein
MGRKKNVTTKIKDQQTKPRFNYSSEQNRIIEEELKKNFNVSARELKEKFPSLFSNVPDRSLSSKLNRRRNKKKKGAIVQALSPATTVAPPNQNGRTKNKILRYFLKFLKFRTC